MRGKLTLKSIVNAFAAVQKTQRGKRGSTKVSLLISRGRERGHYEPEAAWNQGFGAVLQSGRELKELLYLPYYSVQRRNNNAPLVPPKPNEFDMAYSNSALRA